jgi:hypothetical protein
MVEGQREADVERLARHIADAVEAAVHVPLG